MSEIFIHFHPLTKKNTTFVDPFFLSLHPLIICGHNAKKNTTTIKTCAKICFSLNLNYDFMYWRFNPKKKNYW